jgi:hypothetical protein
LVTCRHTPSAFDIHPSTRGEFLRVSGPYSVVGAYFQNNLLLKRISHLSIPYFLFPTSYLSVFIRERCTVNRVGLRSTPLRDGNFYIPISNFPLTHLYLSISHFPLNHLYSVNRVSGQWSVVGEFFQDTPLQEGNFHLLISHFLLTHLYLPISHFPLIHLLRHPLLYERRILLANFSLNHISIVPGECTTDN